MASSSSSSSSSSLSATKLRSKHHVFLSFRGEDTRVGFTSHLRAALEKKCIQTFIDDYLKRGEEISDSLVKAIEDSMLSVVILSQNYASSKWCLEELVKILECRKSRGQIVIPIFYQVDPSDVRKQSGSFGDEFAELVKNKALEMEKEKCFRSALNEAANLSGHDSRNIGSESKFIEEIIKDIFNKLCKMSPPKPTINLAGIYERIRKIESLLEMESEEVRIVGIWGMGGIGKTTLAKAVHNKVCTEFEASYFLSNVREELKRRTVADLQRSFISRLLGQEIMDMDSLSFENHFIKDGLRSKKILLVFDDVDSSMLSKELLEGLHDSFGSGSRILVTSRDQHVLNQVVDATYEVEALDKVESLQLFKSKAFKKIDPTRHHKDLLWKMVDYAKGNPLALVVLGSALCDRSMEDWYSALKGLGQIKKVEIEDVLKISYDGLNKEEKDVFLDIAYFFRGMNRYHVTRILEKKSSFVHYTISVLIDKSLIRASYNTLDMHDLLREMAYSIVRQESENPGKRSRLVDHEDIYHVLKKRKGTKAVKGICLDMYTSAEMQLKSDAFRGMNRLEFLKFHNRYCTVNKSKVQFPQAVLEYLPNKLRYFHWEGYPLKSLPQNFCAKSLVEFDLSGSKFVKLWSGQQDLGNLRRIKLRGSTCLAELPDLSKANRLQYVDLYQCESLTEVPSYFEYFEILEYLNVGNCCSVKYFPRRIGSNKIDTLWLDHCSNIIKFPEISRNLTELFLEGTSIEEVPSSIMHLTNLTHLLLSNCKKLSRLPSSLCKLKSLGKLDLSGCSELENFPEIMEPMESLVELYLRDTAIRELPSSIMLLESLKYMFLNGTLIKELPELPPSLVLLTADGCQSLQIMSASTLGDSLKKLSFTDCFKFDQKALMEQIQLKIQSGKIHEYYGFQMVLPGSEIPEWFSDQSTGSSITVRLPSNPRLELKAVAFCLVIAVDPHVLYDDPNDPDFTYWLNLNWKATSNNGEKVNDTYPVRSFHRSKIYEKDHMLLCCDKKWSGDFSKHLGHEITFEFIVKLFRTGVANNEIGRHLKVKRYGVHLIFDENTDRSTQQCW